MSDDIAEIAAKLTKAQREALANTIGFHDGSVHLRLRVPLQTVLALWRRGLALQKCRFSTVSPRGLAVRDHIMKEQQDGNR
jgi:hypothetical protein